MKSLRFPYVTARHLPFLKIADVNSRGEANMAKEPTIEQPSKALEGARKQFAEFLKENPYSQVIEITRKKDGSKYLVVSQPWGDRSVALYISDEEDDPDRRALADALNSVILPKRLTALYHIDQKVLEVIWT